jgi:hypothetical protein
MARPDDSYDSGSHQNRQSLVRVKQAKDISRKQRYIDLGDAVDPFALGAIKGGEGGVPFSLEPSFDNPLVP